MKTGRVNRRQVLGGVAAFAALSTGASRTAAQDELGSWRLSQIPSTGSRREGPIAVGTVGRDVRSPGEVPIAIQIPQAGVDASIERVEIVDGVMQNPSGPWVVSWYHDLAVLGRNDNVVMAGHVDYWDVGPAVFWNLSQLVPGDRIEVVSERERPYSYAVEWMKNYVVADMTAADLDEMLGDAGGEALTLITCTIGSWDAAAQEYRERTALRAIQI
jgi:hypothetical protein